jgi:hypothetical protein
MRRKQEGSKEGGKEGKNKTKFTNGERERRRLYRERGKEERV